MGELPINIMNSMRKRREEMYKLIMSKNLKCVEEFLKSIGQPPCNTSGVLLTL